MKVMGLTAAAATLIALATHADAASFGGYEVTGDLIFAGAATFDYDPSFLGGAIFDDFSEIDIALSADLSTGSLELLDGSVISTALLSTMVSTDGDIGDDSFAALFSLGTGPASFAIAEFKGTLDGDGFSDFASDGVFFTPGTLTVLGARLSGPLVVPVPAAFLLLSSSILGLAALRRK